MDSIISKVSYLSGLVDGLSIDENTKEGKVLIEIVNVLKDMAQEMLQVSEAQKDIQESIDDLDEDISDLQDYFYDSDYELCHDEGNNFIQIECPSCGDTIYIDKDIVNQEEEISCPSCHNKMPLTENNE